MAGTTQPNPSTFLKGQMPEIPTEGVSYTQATIAVAQFGRHIVKRAGVLHNVAWDIGNSGTVTPAAFRVRLNGTPIAGATATSANGSAHTTGTINCADQLVNPGDVIDFDVTAAPTGGTNLTVSPNIALRYD